MRALVKLFGRSPFAPLRAHMDKVAKCVRKLSDLFDALPSKDKTKISKLAKAVSKLEHEADLTKNDIRTNLKSHLFLPVDRTSLLEILGIQDGLADQAEDVAILLAIRPLTIPSGWEEEWKQFVDKNLEAFEGVYKVMAELNELLESSFGGLEAEKIRTMVDHVAYLEHEVDLVQRALVHRLYNDKPELSHSEFALWHKLIEQTSGLSNLAEKLANRILMTMELK